jgi:tetratricopeptide (TPR) repeat protein
MERPPVDGWEESLGKKRVKKKSRVSRDRAGAAKLVSLSYEIVYVPVKNEYNEKSKPPEVEREQEELYYLSRENPREAVPRLRALIEKYPDIPVLYNYLTVAYTLMKEQKSADELVLETYRRFPDYLFAKAAYAEICLNADRLEEIPRIFDHKFDLKLLYPERTQFHITEFTAFAGTVGYYFCRKGELDVAESFYGVLKGMEPEDPQTVRLGRALAFQKGVERVRRFLFPKRDSKP